MSPSKTHRWRFVRAGGFDQVVIDSGADLRALPSLDLKLWVALACPIEGVEFDARTLHLLDADRDGRIQAPDVLAAVRWACAMIDADELAAGRDTMPLSSVDLTVPEGAQLRATAKAMLASIEMPDADAITVDEVARAVKVFDQQPFNGDGVLPPAAGPDEETKSQLRDVLSCTASPERGRDGQLGVTQKSLDAFFAQIDAHQSWERHGDAPLIRPVGDDTAAVFASLGPVRTKIDEYLGRAKLAACDVNTVQAHDESAVTHLDVARQRLAITSAELEHMPVPPLRDETLLPLTHGVSATWAARIADLRQRVTPPKVEGKDRLSEGDWTTLVALFAQHAKWTEAKAAAAIEKLLGTERIVALAAPEVRAKLSALIAKDHAREREARDVELVEKLVRFHRYLIDFVNNFVSFRDFYARSGQAMFQAGRLYLDQRSFELVVHVSDPSKHAAMAPLASSYLVYCDCKSADGRAMQIAAAVTAGDVDNLMVGRNGLFFDRAGGSWDATIAKIYDNPISVGQAFWSPYKRVIRTVEEQIAKRASDATAAQDAHLANVATAPAVPAAPARPAPATTVPAATTHPPPRRLDIGTLAAIGVAVGGVTAALGAILQAFFGLGVWMPIGIVGLMLCISGPSMAVAWLKLRRRNLGPILDANGWAVNARAKVNVPLGRSLTHVAKIPEGSDLHARDPFADRRHPWPLYLAIAVLAVALVAWGSGVFDAWIPLSLRRSTWLHMPTTDTATDAGCAPSAGPDAGTF